MNWLQEIVNSYESNEAPQRFFYWSGLTAISAVVRKNVHLNRFHYKLYPNIFTFIVAGSGMKKGIPIGMAKRLVTKTNCTRIIMGRNSMPRVIQDLGKAFTLEGGGVISLAQGFLISGELAAFFVQDPNALTILTDLHNTHEYEDFWTNSLKGDGTGKIDKLKQPCLTLLGGTNEEHFAGAVPSNAIGGGFVARTFIVLCNEKGTLNSLTTKPTNVPDEDHLACYLKEISKVHGEFSWTKEAIKLYDAWYYEFYTKKFHDPTGTMNRLGDQILKASMLISLSESLDLTLKQEHIFEAITVCEECVNGMMQVTMGNGTQNLAAATKTIMRELILHPSHTITKAQLLQKYWGQFDDFDITRIAETLQASGAIEITLQGKTFTYKMKKEALEMYTNFKRGVM